MYDIRDKAYKDYVDSNNIHLPIDYMAVAKDAFNAGWDANHKDYLLLLDSRDELARMVGIR